MQVYQCKKCGSQYDYVNIKDGRSCEVCAGPLKHKGFEVPYWGAFTKQDHDAVTN